MLIEQFVTLEIFFIKLGFMKSFPLDGLLYQASDVSQKMSKDESSDMFPEIFPITME